MNIKSLLLGSAAALVAVSGARAADAVVMVEPEPAEYVKVCDVYGTGYFYIPGTETCLKIGGYVRMRVVANDASSNTDLDLGNINETLTPDQTIGIRNDDYNMSTSVRARIDFDAREETELGMLRAFARVQASNSASNLGSNYILDSGFLQLGGLTAGKLDSLWAEDDGLFTDNDWSVGDFNNNRISYTFAANGFAATLSLEDDGSGDFAPDVVGHVLYKGGWGEAYVSGVYDEQPGTSVSPTLFFAPGGAGNYDSNFAISNLRNTLAFSDPTTGVSLVDVFSGDVNNDDGAFALKAGVTLKDLLVAGSQFKVEGSYAFDPTVYTTNGYLTGEYNGTNFGTEIVQNGIVYNGPANGGLNLSTEWQVGAGYQQTFGKLTAYLSGIYGETFDLKGVTDVSATGVVTTRDFGNAKYYGVAGNLGYQVTTNFSVLGEVSYREIDLPSGFNDFNETGGFIELKRTF